jgi:hypothetical protein
MSDFVISTVIITSALAGLGFCIVVARSIAAVSEAMNEQNERHSQHMRMLTNMFAETSVAISEKNLELLMRKHDMPQAAPVTRYAPPPPPEDTFDINAIIEAGPPPHGGDPSK